MIKTAIILHGMLGSPSGNWLQWLKGEWEAIRANVKKILFVHSDDDPYVPLPQAQFVANNCQAELITIPGQGHFSLEKSDGYSMRVVMI